MGQDNKRKSTLLLYTNCSSSASNNRHTPTPLPSPHVTNMPPAFNNSVRKSGNTQYLILFLKDPNISFLFFGSGALRNTVLSSGPRIFLCSYVELFKHKMKPLTGYYSSFVLENDNYIKCCIISRYRSIYVINQVIGASNFQLRHDFPKSKIVTSSRQVPHHRNNNSDILCIVIVTRGDSRYCTSHRLLKGRTGYSAARGLELGSEYEKGCIF